jgi:hypothetical protein
MPRSRNRNRAADDNPVIKVFMLLLLLGGAFLGIRHALSDKSIVKQYASTGDSRRGPNTYGSPTGFVDDFKRLPQDATALQRAADEGFKDAARALGADELTWVKSIMARGARSRDSYSDSELASMREFGFGKWVDAQAIRWSQEDPAFETVSSAVYGRSSRDLRGLAVSWGEKGRSARQELLRLIQVVESNARELTGGERATVAEFAGEEYLANRQ